jgi:hypothetical protein
MIAHAPISPVVLGRIDSGERRRGDVIEFAAVAEAWKVMPWTYHGIWPSFSTPERAEWSRRHWTTIAARMRSVRL